MIVVDTNVLTYLVVASEKTAVAQQTYQKDNHWVAPSLWQHELLNVLATHVKLDILNLTDALLAWQNCQQLLADRSFDVDMEAALQLAATEETTAYDAQFVLLAQTLGCPFVTEDRQLVKKFPGLALTFNEYLLT
jgi:predicted nucleic acid-binding protein